MDNRSKISEIIFRCTISSILGIFTQLALLSIPHFFGAFSLLFQMISSVAVLLIAVTFGQLVRRFFGVRASAPAFVVFHMIFIWIVYVIVVREAVSLLVNILFNGIFAFLLNGYFRMLFSDPGSVRCDLPSTVEVLVAGDSAPLKEPPPPEAGHCLENSTEEHDRLQFSEKFGRREGDARANTSTTGILNLKGTKLRAWCHGPTSLDNLKQAASRAPPVNSPVVGGSGFPSWLNLEPLVGQKNHALFMVLLVGFILTEILYALIAYQWIRNEIHQANNTEIAKCLAVSTMMFSWVQVLWQLPFFLWHVYCVSFNIKSNEWVSNSSSSLQDSNIKGLLLMVRRKASYMLRYRSGESDILCA
ncbi:hypothetical protein KSS87_006890 [Heliosperma pusillum]|nr:hypothetical protein KSS87_006890 [Heliosperma pusillum]